MASSAGFDPGKQSSIALLLARLMLVWLVLYGAVVLAKLTWMVVWDEQPAVVRSGVGVTNGRGAGAGAPLATYEFFGVARENGQVADVVRRSAPETSLRLKLEGVMVAQQPEESGAIVAGSDGVTEFYKVGDTLPGNARLAEVEPRRVLIRRNGRYETLTFEEPVSGDLITDVAAEGVASSPEAFMDEARAQIETEGIAALSRYGLSPSEDGNGYRYDGSNALLTAANLRPGDVITSINGQALGDFEQDKELLGNWRSESRLEIEIERGGARMTVSFAIPEQWR
ncbi:MAG: type II secretion system protein N [Pseudomonadota bacterium]|nr:type II secretion system protein N [Pseudomonadota bacterium]